MTAIASESQATAASSAASAAPASSAAAPASSAASSAPASSAASQQSVASSTVSASSAASKAPDKYELKLPANVKNVDASVITRTEAIARSQGLDNAAAQGLLDAVVAEVVAQDTAKTEAWTPGTGAAWKARDAEWRAAALADPLVGGTPEKLATSIELAKKVTAKFGGEDVNKFLIDTGLGSHPVAIKLFAQIGRAMSESSLISGNTGIGGEKKSPAKALYGEDGTGKKS